MADKIGFIGVGTMGEPMCRNLARKSRLDVLAADRDAAPLKRLAADGVKSASIDEIAAECRIIMLSLPGYVVAQVWSLKRLEVGWRTAAWVPLVVMGAALVVSLFALSRGSNLWPIWLILLAPLALIWLGGLMLLNRSTANA